MKLKDCRHYQMAELIDTLWNVNEDVLQELADMVDELIDTLWNVN